MKYRYKWEQNEANFGKPIKKQVTGGTHITLELILKYGNKFVALSRESIPGHELPDKEKQDYLFFCHGLIRYGESLERAVKRIIREQCGVKVKSHRVVYIESVIQNKDKQWAFTPHVVVNLLTLPRKGKQGNLIKKVVVFSKEQLPDNFAWWSNKDLEDFLNNFG